MVIIGVTVGPARAVGLFFRRTTLGVQMRAAAEDFRMARVLGIRADAVVAVAFALSACSPAVAAILLTARTGSVSPTLGVNIVLYRVHGDDRRRHGQPARRGARAGSSIGALTVALQATLPLDLRPYRDAFVFAAVLALLVVRPQGLVPAPPTLAREEPGGPRLDAPAARRAVRRPRALPAEEDSERRAPGARSSLRDRVAGRGADRAHLRRRRWSPGRSARTRSTESWSGW